MSASSATDPDSATITICSSAVAPIPARLTQAACRPMALDSSAVRIASPWSWLCGVRAWRSRARNPEPWSWRPWSW
ncbi:hypothetical protein ACTXJ3_00760 [Brachybacterium paraconglomeratum]|uniref:hypothetical protein n=1 Tax=Brachybacterium paraconglomeratum TaxID=173362 RepID=UPI003FD55CF6